MNPKMASVPNPNLSDNMLAFSIAQNLIAALSNHVTGGATVINPAIGVPIVPITSPLITVKSSGKFLVTAAVTLSFIAGTMVDADQVTFNPTRIVAVGPVTTQLQPATLNTAASTATGGGALRTIVAFCSFTTIDTSGVAVGAQLQYALTVSALDGHSAGVVATADGTISVLELPG